MYDSEIWSLTGKIFSHFGPFFAFLLKKQNFEKKKKKKSWRYHQLTLVYHKWKSYDVWFLRYKVQRTEFFRDCFLPFRPTSPRNLENQNLDKIKKKFSWRYCHLHHKCINENHIMYCFWDMECDRQNFSHFGPFFALLLP